jgi:hypothetical protein
MVDITRQWQKPIRTKKLRETPAAYMTFKISCQNPHWTHEQLSKHTGHSIYTIQEWSSKYYHRTRKEAYFQHLQDEMEEQIVKVKHNDLTSHIERQPRDQKLIDNDKLILETMQQALLQKLEFGQEITREEIQEYVQFKDSYVKSQKEHAATTQTVLRNVYEGVDPDAFNHEELSAGARRLIESLRERRQTDKEDETDE